LNDQLLLKGAINDELKKFFSRVGFLLTFHKKFFIINQLKKSCDNFLLFKALYDDFNRNVNTKYGETIFLFEVYHMI